MKPFDLKEIGCDVETIKKIKDERVYNAGKNG